VSTLGENQRLVGEILEAALQRMGFDAKAYELRSEWVDHANGASWGIFPNVLMQSGKPQNVYGVSVHHIDGNGFDWTLTEALRATTRLLAMNPPKSAKEVMAALHGEQ
jgi:hypothetical protein